MSLKLPGIIIDDTLGGSAMTFRKAVRAATTTNGTLTTDFANGSTLDGVSLVTGDRILLKDQTTATDNGIYVVQATGVPIRSIDYADTSAVSSTFILVREGTVNANTGWLCTNNESVDIVGTNSLTYQLATGSVNSAVSSTDNAIVRWNGTNGAAIQDSGVTIDDSDNLAGIVNLVSTGYTQLADIVAPSNAADGQGRLYKKTGNTGLFWLPDSTGPEVDLTSTGAGGEVNTASNVGTGDGWYKTKVGVDLRFKSLVAGSTKLSVVNNIDDLTVDIDETNIDHGLLVGLADDDHTQYALLVGRAGGQSLVGGTAASESLTLESTNNITKGTIIALSPVEADDLDAHTATTLLLGKGTATKIELANTGVTTEAQGPLTALEGVGVTGNITVTGTVDGRDVSVDGSTLDSHIADSTIHFTVASIDHGLIAGLADDDHTQYALLAGRAGGQSLIGGTAASDSLTLESTSNVTKGTVQVLSPLEADDLDSRTATTLLVGKNTATKIELAKTGVTTEAQGPLAALEGVGVTGNITVTGTVDGRDVSVDGSTLDSHVASTAAHGATGAVVGTTNTQTLTNKTLTSPVIGNGIFDTNGNELFIFTATASAVNELTYANAATGNGPSFTATGGDTDIDFTLTPKGAGNLILDSLIWPNTDGLANQVLQTNGAGTLGWATIDPITVATITTSDATLTTIAVIGTTSNTSYLIKVKIVARRTDTGTESAGYILNGVYRNNGGTLTLVGQDKTSIEDTQQWDVDLNTSGINMTIEVMGQGGKTINWKASYTVISV